MHSKNRLKGYSRTCPGRTADRPGAAREDSEGKKTPRAPPPQGPTRLHSQPWGWPPLGGRRRWRRFVPPPHRWRTPPDQGPGQSQANISRTSLSPVVRGKPVAATSAPCRRSRLFSGPGAALPRCTCRLAPSRRLVSCRSSLSRPLPTVRTRVLFAPAADRPPVRSCRTRRS